MMISIDSLAEKLGKVAEKRTLPNGKEVSQIVWKGEDLTEISKLLHNTSGDMPEVVKINGRAPAWLVAGITHECHPRMVEVNSVEGYIPIGCNVPKGVGSGENIRFSVVMREDDWTIVKGEAIDPSIPFDPEELEKITPPEVSMGSKVIVSGRLPNWMTVTLAMAYHGTAKAVACFQPGAGATVCWTHVKSVGLGEVIPE